MATIAEEISALRGRISQAYDVIDQKGGDVPFDRTSWNLSASIDSIRVGGEVEDVNGISSLYAVIPAIDENGKFSGTLQKGPYHVDWSNMRLVNAYATSPRSLLGRPGFWSYDDLSTYDEGVSAQWTAVCPNVSSIDMHNLTSVQNAYGLYGTFCGNLNILSVWMPEQHVATSTQYSYQFAGCFRATRLPCDFPHLTASNGTYAFANAWVACQPKYNPLDIQERYLPDLQRINGAYTFTYAWQNYRPKYNKFLNLSNLTSLVGTYAFSYAMQGDCEIERFRLGVDRLTEGNTFDRVCQNNTHLSSFELPNLTAITGGYMFSYAFSGASKISSISFPALKSLGGNSVFTYCWNNCSSIQRIDFPELTTILTANTGTFNSSVYTTIDNAATRYPVLELHFPKLKTWRMGTAATQSFQAMAQQATVSRRRKYKMYFDAVTNITAGTTAAQATFGNGYGLTEMYFNSLSSITNNYMFTNNPELTAIHFAAEHEDAIKATAGYATLWGRGAGAATVFWDL